MNVKKYICEDSIDGIFTAVYDAWASKADMETIRIETRMDSNFELFTEYINVSTDYSKSEKVANTIKKKLGQDCYMDICHAALSGSDSKANAVFRFIRFGLLSDIKMPIMNALGKKEVSTIFELSRNVYNEAHHLLGFIRFKELHNGVLFSEIEPKNNILTLIASHFADRLSKENWMIHDKKRQLFIIHKKEKAWLLISGEQLNLDETYNVSEYEMKFQSLWKEFCHNISIKERENKKLQQQNLPLRFQKDMVEFN